MDDELERPTSSVPASNLEPADAYDAGQSSDDEDDGGLDWTKLSAITSSSTSKPIIPKRGDKEFEPAGGVDAGGTGTGLQQHKLERVRAAMFSALDVERTVSSKVASYAVWYPELSRARLLTARGNFLTSMGHNVPIQALQSQRVIEPTPNKQKKAGKVVELLPEEALYLMERGSMFCVSVESGGRMDGSSGGEDDERSPMTVQQAYAEMIGKEELTLERYQVYAYLKRLGYTVTRARAPDPFYNTAPPYSSESTITAKTNSGLFARIMHSFSSTIINFIGLKSSKSAWWRPLKIEGLLNRFPTYSSIFSSLRFLSSGYKEQLTYLPPPTQPSPYEIFFHLYKPTSPYRKTSPPPPDFSVIVVDGRKTPMPTLSELCILFEQLPELPPPVPRKRQSNSQQTASSVKKDAGPQKASGAIVVTQPTSLYERIPRLLRCLFNRGTATDETRNAPPRRPNPFQMLKMGKKMIVVAAVDAGMISFFRFCQGSFDEWPMA